ncbi:MAG: hypothetical protein EOL86_02775 [Deltaproteobacteria bacterium]|nr:hypothetical protein [Deltaproteobacteria bacterium]
MDLHTFLIENHKGIAEHWVSAIFKTYPEEGAKFFSGSSNQFANPVGHSFRSNVESMILTLAKGGDVADCATALDGILRIRAVQGFRPSVALCFLPALKEIVFREVSKHYPAESVDALLHDWNLSVDRLTMMGFDLYVDCRELLWKQKANQLYSRTHKLLERANVLTDEEVAG